MKRKIKKYKVGRDSDVYAISMVEMPAIEEDFIALAKQEEEKVFLSSDEKHLCYGAVLVPDKDIYRYDGEREYYISFTKESIEKMSQDFMKEYHQSDITLDHKDAANEICVVESWLKSDPYKDKSVALGLNPDLPVGTWFCAMKVNNVDAWERVKKGELKGFSVESLVSLEEFEKQNDNNMINVDEMSFWTKLKEVLKEAFSKEVEEPEEKMEDEITIGDECAVEMEEQAPETPTEAVPEPQEAVEEVKVEDAPVVEKEAVTEEIKPQEPQPNPLEEVIRNLQEEIKALKDSNDKLVGKVKDLGKQPSSKPLSTNAKADPKDTYQQWRNAMREMIG